MKRFILAFCAALLLCGSAFAEGSSVLWQNTGIYTDGQGKEASETVTVSMTTIDGVAIEQIETAEDDLADGYFAKVTKEGAAPVTICITPACVGAHANLNEATDEQLQQYIDIVSEDYEDPTSEISRTDDGNVYLSVGNDVIRSVWTIYDDTTIEIIQANDDYTTPLTADDQAFAVEVLKALSFSSTDGL